MYILLNIQEISMKCPCPVPIKQLQDKIKQTLKKILQKNKKPQQFPHVHKQCARCLSGEYVYPSEINISLLPQLRNTIAISLYKFIEIYINDLSHTKNAKFDHCAGNIGPICKQNKIKITIEFKCNLPIFFIIVSRSTYCEAIQVPI